MFEVLFVAEVKGEEFTAPEPLVMATLVVMTGTVVVAGGEKSITASLKISCKRKIPVQL